MNKFEILFPELNENQRKMLSTLIEGAIPNELEPVTVHIAGYNTAIQEIRNNLKEAGVLK
jgi:hypothetical protein